MKLPPLVVFVLLGAAALSVAIGLFGLVWIRQHPNRQPIAQTSPPSPEQTDPFVLANPLRHMNDSAPENGVSPLQQAIAEEARRIRSGQEMLSAPNSDGVVHELAEDRVRQDEYEQQSQADVPKALELMRQIPGAPYQQRAKLCNELFKLKQLSRRAVEPQVRALLSDPFPLVQATAAAILVNFGEDPVAFEKLKELAHDRDPEVRQRVLEAFQYKYDSSPQEKELILEMLPDEYSGVQLMATTVMANWSSVPASAAPALYQALEGNDQNTRCAAIQCLAHITPMPGKAVTKLLTLMHDENPIVSGQAMESLASLDPKPKGYLPALISCAEHADQNTLRLAYSALGIAGKQDKQAVAFLLKTAGKNSGLEVALALEQLEHLQIKEAVPCAEKLVNSSDKDIALAAKRVLIYVGGRSDLLNIKH
jgi:HEAT repeat protein